MKLGTNLKKNPKLFFLWQLLLVLALVVALITIISSFYLANNPPVYFKVISGSVTASDGNSYSDAKEGIKIPLNVRTLIKTDSQVASIQLWNGSLVIMDSDSSIEFNRPNENEPEMSFAFNLLKGRVLVVNEENGLIPVKIFIGSDNTVRASQSAMGLVVFSDSKRLNEVDCLFGKCLVNGIHLLFTGQNARIGPGEIIQVTEGASITDWISLWKASNLKPELKNLLVSFIPTITPTNIQTTPILTTEQAFLPLVSNSIFQTPTPSLLVLQNMTPSRTSFTFPTQLLTPNRTIYPIRIPTTTKTQSPVNDPIPTRTLTPSLTPVPQVIPTRTYTPTLSPTDSPLPTYTPIPSNTWTPTVTPSPIPTETPTPIPTETPSPIPTQTPTPTPKKLTKTPTPTDTDPTPTPTNVPTATPTNVPTATPTDVPTPTPTNMPTPTPTDDPTPTPTDVPTPTSTDEDDDDD